MQVLDRESIRLIRNECRHEGRKSLKVLRNFYCGTGRSKVLSLFTEIGNLRKSECESITNFILRAEEVLQSLKACNHPVDEMISIAFVVNGLPKEYKHFRTIVFQTDNIKTFAYLKSALINFEQDGVKNNNERNDHIVLGIKKSV